MDDWANVRVFGTRIDNLPLVIRPSAYAVIWDEGRVAIVRQPLGGIFLPGGGIDAGETPEQAAVRETGEECGLVVRILGALPRVIQFASAKDGRQYFEKRSSFFSAEVVRTAPELLTPNHETFWVSPGEAVRLLSHESHKYVVRQLRSSVLRS
jgi:8-oxo-dGTP diphosphatase